MNFIEITVNLLCILSNIKTYILSIIKFYSLVPSHVFYRSLPHSIRSDLADICLFTKDNPNVTPEKTEHFYKKLLNKHGIKTISQVGSWQLKDLTQLT